MAGPTRLELATSGVTGRRSNQLNYDPASYIKPIAMAPRYSDGTQHLDWWAVQDSNL